MPIHSKNVINFARMRITKNPSLNICSFLSNEFSSVPIHSKNVLNFARIRITKNPSLYIRSFLSSEFFINAHSFEKRVKFCKNKDHKKPSLIICSFLVKWMIIVLVIFHHPHLFCLAAAADPSLDFDLQDSMDLLVLAGAGVWLDELMAAKTDFVLLDDMSSLKWDPLTFGLCCRGLPCMFVAGLKNSHCQRGVFLWRLLWEILNHLILNWGS